MNLEVDFKAGCLCSYKSQLCSKTKQSQKAENAENASKIQTSVFIVKECILPQTIRLSFPNINQVCLNLIS